MPNWFSFDFITYSLYLPKCIRGNYSFVKLFCYDLFFFFVTVPIVSIKPAIEFSKNQTIQRVFCEEIIRNRPNKYGYTWHSVIINLNEFLFANGAWPTRYCFYDEKEILALYYKIVYYKVKNIKYDTFANPTKAKEEPIPDILNRVSTLSGYILERYLLAAIIVVNQADICDWLKEYENFKQEMQDDCDKI